MNERKRKRREFLKPHVYGLREKENEGERLGEIEFEGKAEREKG